MRIDAIERVQMELIDYTITEEDVKALSDDELARLFIHTDCDRKELDAALLI